ncbi:MAG: polyprenol monophosphomannose synthase [Myxococcales bacterium]|nr:polyprenol monophosphomannose synthase [Myxococcales bacterium]
MRPRGRLPAGRGPRDGGLVPRSASRYSPQRVNPASSTPARLVVSLAMYNEAENVRPLVLAIREHAPHASILLIDDNSPDGTGAICDQLATELADVTVVHRAGKQGLGSAIVHAMKYAIEHGYDYYLNLDADFSHPPRFIPALLAGMQDHDVMIGSRYIPGGGVEGEFGLRRKAMSFGINGLARVCLGLRTRDNSGSFRCYRVSKLAQIDLDHVRSRGYSFMEEILFLCRQVGCTFGETPILFEDRRAGRSKLNKAEALRSVGIIVQLGLERVAAAIRS